MRKLVLLAFVGLAGAGVAVIPSLGSAQATTASFTAVDNGDFLHLPTWNASASTAVNDPTIPGAPSVRIVPGGTVFFSYPSGNSSYNAVFDGPQPSSCIQTAATAPFKILPAPPLPAGSQPAGWAGSCRFDTPGTYTFHDGARGPQMSGTVYVGTTTTPPPTTTTTTTTPSGTTSTSFHEPPIPAAASTLRAASTQRGTVVRGQIHVTTPSSRLVANLYLGSSSVRVGRTTIFGVRDGVKHFAVRLYASSARRLRAQHRLALTLRVQILGQGVGPTLLSRHVTLTG
ncbi:MAG: hypothetical protein ACR2KV_18190 [Solirubrobacteraceae bacterium]